MSARTPPNAFVRAFADVGLVLAAWAIVLVLEYEYAVIAERSLFVASWEVAIVRRVVTPIAFGAFFPLALVIAIGGRFVATSRTRSSVTVAIGAALTAYGTSFGRHFASLPLRAAYVFLVASGFATVLAFAWPRLVRVRRGALAVGAVVLALFAWAADAFVLPRLYPAFHLALFVSLLVASALATIVIPRDHRASQSVAATAIALSIAALFYTPKAARRVRTADNVRFVLVEHAPVLGRAVILAAKIAPPESIDDARPDAAHAPPGEIARTLDWSGKDVVLISIDALRADHVGAYGYARATTPNIDELAKEGTLFEDAYCPTPHTSYSVTSMMTGKYMRPLLALGLGDSSQTWAALMRTYGYRTAAFYPPAVFYIDEDRFKSFQARALDFEYRKIEFADAHARDEQLRAYLARADKSRPLFLWVHMFEPHEPYVVHEEHRFASGDARDVDAYDSEIAAADDGVGAVVARVRAWRPGAIVIVTADHGEEFGDHGGRYHGTSVYEEQVRVPLVVVGPGVKVQRVTSPVQTIDLLPTTLSAIGIPRPARIRGRDLGPLLAGTSDAKNDPGTAFVETDEYALVARGDDRLVCARRAAACALYDVAHDRKETHDLSSEAPDRARALKAELQRIERDHGKFEQGEGAQFPEAIRRGLQGEREASIDVAALLDDANVTVRRKAAEVTYRLHAPDAYAQVTRAMKREEDTEVASWCALAVVRMDAEAKRATPPSAAAIALLRDPKRAWRRAAALALAESGDTRGESELVAWWHEDAPPNGKLAFEDARDLASAFAKLRAKSAVPSLIVSLEDVRLRPYIADALGAIGDPSARAPLLDAFAQERYVTARPREAQALLKLGARAELRSPLARFAGTPDPMVDALDLARDAGLLVADAGGWSNAAPVNAIDLHLALPRERAALRLLVESAREGSQVTARVFGRDLEEARAIGALHVFEVGDAPDGVRAADVHLEDSAGLRAAWIVARAKEIEPPAPKAWEKDAGIAEQDEP